MRRSILLAAFTLLAAHSAHAQSLRHRISELFIFGPGSDPLFLAGTADPDNPASIRVHGEHFIPSAVSENGSVIDFLAVAVGRSVSSVPIGSASSGETFRFEGGIPVKTSTSAGPILAERSQTLGRGRALVGLGRTNFHFTSLRGQDLNNLSLNFTHQNVDFAGCDSATGGKCSLMGWPLLENDFIQVQLGMSMDVNITTLYTTYGLFDNLDLSVIVPMVSTHLSGTSVAQIVPFGGSSTATHFFGGTPQNPELSATRQVTGSANGVGDVAVRAKLLVRETSTAALAVFGEGRFATGDANDFLGAGYFSGRGVAALTAMYGAFSPHANLGYLYRSSTSANDAVLTALGFDDLMAPGVTIAVDVLSELQVGASKLTLPGPVSIEYPFRRTILPTTIPDTRDDIVNGSLGFKFTHSSGATAIVNAMVPLNTGGLRGRMVYTAGVEYAF